jgi:two-component system sensor histidine kinase/response regulator
MSGSIKHETIDELRELAGDTDPEFLPRLLELFLGGLSQKMKRIETALQTSKPDDLHAETHALKSSAANVGAMQMSFLCSELEKYGKAGNISATVTQELFVKLKSEASLVTSELESLPEMKSFKRKAA